MAVHFKLQEAELEKDNNKGDKRFFIPKPRESSYNPQAKEIVIPFEFRPLTEQERIKYGTRNHQQETIIAEALEEITAHFKNEKEALAALIVERRQAADGRSVSYLEHHLRQYTRRNTSDFFIHKDLKGFLMRELDFYLKNEVLNLDDLEAAGETRAEGWFQVMRVIRAIGTRIITFLAQIENFQKKLFEKKKFITETQYCITVGNIGEAFYREIAANDAQWAEWKELFHIDEDEQNLFTAAFATREEKRVAYLKTHPTLVLDTKHFDRDFVDRLLASIEDLDDQIDGLLVNSENFQALNLLLEKYRGKVKCIYIDPPYNTASTKILYKNDYEHSSWLSLLSNRLERSKLFLMPSGCIAVAIDDYEGGYLRVELDQIFSFNNRLGTVVVLHNPGGRHDDKYIATAHEYMYIYGLDLQHTQTNFLPLNEDDIETFKHEDEKGNYRTREFRRSGSNSTREARPKMYYPLLVRSSDLSLSTISDQEYKMIYDDSKGIFDDKYLDQLKAMYEKKGFHFLLPIDSNGIKRVWRWSLETFRQRKEDVFVSNGPNGYVVKVKDRLDEKPGLKPKSVWKDSKYSAALGTVLLKDILGVDQSFNYPKSISTVEDIIRVLANDDDIILDFFAGSGTTGQAVIQLNREDEGERKFILVEMGEYFDTVLLPRIKKVIFTPEWKNGKPERMPTDEEVTRSPRIIKYIRLESYDDALNNISFTSSVGQQVLEFDDYLLKYMLDWETRESETFLNVEKLASPFRYELILIDGQETKIKPVDIPETFNYLLGLHVSSRRVYQDGGRRYLVYHGVIDHRRVAIIWRDTEGWDKKDYERDKEFVVEQKLTEGADEVFVNGDSFIPKAKALEPLFKSRMFGGV